MSRKHSNLRESGTARSSVKVEPLEVAVPSGSRKLAGFTVNFGIVRRQDGGSPWLTWERLRDITCETAKIREKDFT